MFSSKCEHLSREGYSPKPRFGSVLALLLLLGNLKEDIYYPYGQGNVASFFGITILL